MPALTVNRVCGSGAQAIASAAQEIWLGLVDAAVAGGMENMDRAPYLLDGGRWGYRMGNAQIHDSLLRDGLNDAFSGRAFRLAHRRPRRAISTSRARPRTDGPRARNSDSATRRRAANSTPIVAVEIRRPKGPQPFTRMSTTAPGHDRRNAGRSRPRSARTARSPPATRPD